MNYLSEDRKKAHEKLQTRADFARKKACQMMDDGSREYDEIRRLVDEYCLCQYAADAVSNQLEDHE
jgi:hypothetical protein